MKPVLFNIKKILIPLDLSITSEVVPNEAILLATKTNAEIILITVIEGSTVNIQEKYFDISSDEHIKLGEIIVNGVTKQLEKCKAELEKKGISRVSYIIEKGKPYKKIIEAAERIRPDIIIMGAPEISQTKELGFGSNTFRVLNKALCPVLCTNNEPKEGFKNILLPFRDKPHSRESVDYATQIAEIYGSTIHILGISYDTSEEGIKKIKLEGEQIIHILNERNVKNTLEIVTGSYVTDLINDFVVKKQADLLVVMADIDKVSISDFIIGPVIQRLINHSTIPVLSIHPKINPNMLEPQHEAVNAVDWKFWV
jgi:nucleotide-binding universal stress UspA family protein